MSLKQTILYYLEKNGYLALQDLEKLCKSEQKKLSNGERRLREIMAVNPKVQTEKNSAGAIIAYKWSETQNTAPIDPKRHQLYDCPSWNVYKVYCGDCREAIELASLTKAELKTLF
jgi:hypothetical protein